MCYEFDSDTNTFVFSQNDMSVYTPGYHEITITGSLGDQSDSTSFYLSLVNPCDQPEYNWVRAMVPDSMDSAYYQVLGAS